ncbi:hypothetical protein HZS_2086 [Henneguya salminicola]|nr:hypothetical protein HZS_2086 [Henneguya salminicola]
MVHHTLFGDSHVFFVGGVCIIEEECSREMKLSRQMTHESLPICKKVGEEVNISRNFGRRIAGSWILGMVEYYKQPEGSYKSKEVRLHHVERCDANTLLPIIRDNNTPGSVVWSDQWPSHRRIWGEGGGGAKTKAFKKYAWNISSTIRNPFIRIYVEISTSRRTLESILYFSS